MKPPDKLRALWLVTLVLFPVVVSLLGGAAPVSAVGDDELQDGQTYWQGEILTAGNAAAPGETLTVNSTDTGDTELSMTADNDGDITLDTSSLPRGGYNLTNSTGVTLFEFEIAIQDLSATYEGLQLAFGGELKKAVIPIDSNRGTFNLTLFSSAWSSNRTVEAHGGENLTLNVSTLPDGPHTVHGDVVDTTAEFSVVIDVSTPPSFVYVFPERSTETELLNDTHPFQDGGTYWQGENALWDNGTPGLTYQIRDSNGNLVRERVINSTGHALIDTTGLDGTYDLSVPSSGQTVGSFTVKVQTVTFGLSANNSTLTQGESTTFTLSTNRNGSDFALWSDKLTRSELERAVPSAERVDGEVVLQNVSDGDSFQFQTGHISAGTYQLGAWSTDSDSQDRLSLVIQADDSDETSGNSPGGSTGGSTSSQSTATATATPKPTTTSTPAGTPTAEPTATPTPRPETVTVVKTVVKTVTVTVGSTSTVGTDDVETATGGVTEGPGQPGFGFATAVAATLLVLLAAGQRDRQR